MTSSSAKPLRASRSDANFRLSEADRRKLIAGFDADALERLLAWITPERRSEILAGFQISGDATRSHGWIKRITDPHLQALLEEVWAPMWDHAGATDEDVERNTYEFPGREIAAQRRLARNPAPSNPE